jgi:stage V sporulation protein B
MPQLGIKGSAWATVADIGVAAIMNMVYVNRFVGYNIDLKEVLKTVVATVMMGIVVYYSYAEILLILNSNTLATIGAIAAGGIAYGVVLIITGSVHERDLSRIPLIGSLLCRLLRRVGVFKVS